MDTWFDHILVLFIMVLMCYASISISIKHKNVLTVNEQLTEQNIELRRRLLELKGAIIIPKNTKPHNLGMVDE